LIAIIHYFLNDPLPQFTIIHQFIPGATPKEVQEIRSTSWHGGSRTAGTLGDPGTHAWSQNTTLATQVAGWRGRGYHKT